MPLMQEVLFAGKKVRFAPKGTSMLPLLRQGLDEVILSPLPEKLNKFDLPLYRRTSGQYVLHRIVQTGETYTCIGDNQFEYETGLKEEQMIALVTSIVRDGHEISVTDLRYRFYCRFWHYSRPLRRFWRRARNWLRRRLK